MRGRGFNSEACTDFQTATVGTLYSPSSCENQLNIYFERFEFYFFVIPTLLCRGFLGQWQLFQPVSLGYPLWEIIYFLCSYVNIF